MRKEAWWCAVLDNFDRTCLDVATALGLEIAGESGKGSWRRTDWRRRGSKADSDLIGIFAREEAGEVGGLVQVDPEGVDIYAGVLIEEYGELVVLLMYALVFTMRCGPIVV